MDYIRTHWRGDQTLFWSFWVNLVVIRAIILFFDRFTHPPFTDKSMAAIFLTVAFFVVFHLIVFPWQILGLIRACDRYLSELGSYMIVLMVQLAMVLSLLVTLIFVLGSFQSLFANPEALHVNRWKPPPPLLEEHTLSLNDDGTRILLKGNFNIGITKEMKSLIEQNPEVEGVAFSSNGGRVTEGRGVARLIKKHGLTTYVFDVCKSACTTAFIGGEARILGRKGKIGFHQYALGGLSNTPYIDPVKEQKVDMAFYREQGIGEAFLEKAFQSAHEKIWFPTTDELLAAGVIHKALR